MANQSIAPYYVQRPVEEFIDLRDRRRRLEAFYHGAPAGSPPVTFDALDKAERDRLQRQLYIMRAYAAVLLERIVAGPDDDDYNDEYDYD